MAIVANKIFSFVANQQPSPISGTRLSDDQFKRGSGSWTPSSLIDMFVFSYNTSEVGGKSLGGWSIITDNDSDTITVDSSLRRHANTIEIYDNKALTKVLIQSPHGLKNNDSIDILHIDEYEGSYSIKNVQTASFDIEIPYIVYPINAQPAWQMTRYRPTIVNTAGETIDTLRQATNQVSNDLGNKIDLVESIPDRRDVVKAINSIQSEVDDNMLKSLLLSIATN